MAAATIAGSADRVSGWLGEPAEHPLDDVEVDWLDDPADPPGLAAVLFSTPQGEVRID